MVEKQYEKTGIKEYSNKRKEKQNNKKSEDKKLKKPLLGENIKKVINFVMTYPV